MKKRKRVLTAVLAAALALGLGGCGRTGGETTPPPGLNAEHAPEHKRMNAPSVARDGLRAVWVATVYNLDYPRKATAEPEQLRAEADEILKTSAEMGMNAVFLQVRPSCDALYPSELFPWSRYLTGDQAAAPEEGFDPLQYWVERAHELGLELHAWVNPFRVTKSGQDELDALAENSPAKVHSEWLVEHEGNFYLDPGIPEVRELVVQGAEELARNYDIDGIHLDDYFYPGRSFDDADTYDRYGGEFSDVGDWRRENVNELIRTLDERLHKIDAELSFGVSPSGVWADRSHQSEGSATTGNYESYYAAYADSRKWVQEGWVDYICPQIYWTIGHERMDYETIARWWSETVEGTGVKLYIGMADYQADQDDPESPWYGLDGLKAQLELNRELAVAGEAHFRYQFLAQNVHLKELYMEWYGEEPEASGSFLSSLSEAEQGHWAAKYYGVLGEMGIVHGYPDGSYHPERSVERSAMVKLVFEAMPYLNGARLREDPEANPLGDAAGTWAEGYIGALCAAGYLDADDYPGGFGQAEAMSRAEVVKLLVLSLGFTDDGSVTETGYPDVDEGHFYVAKATELGIITGLPDGSFAPQRAVDRGSAAAMLLRAMRANI